MKKTLTEQIIIAEGEGEWYYMHFESIEKWLQLDPLDPVKFQWAPNNLNVDCATNSMWITEKEPSSIITTHKGQGEEKFITNKINSQIFEVCLSWNAVKNRKELQSLNECKECSSS